MRAETVEMPLMVAEPAHVRPEHREKLVQLIFEKFQPPALFVAKTSVLSSFAVGRPTSLVIDCGASGESLALVSCFTHLHLTFNAPPPPPGTVVSAVHDGYCLQKSVLRNPIGGAALTEATLNAVLASGNEVRPRFQFKRTTKDGSIHIEPSPKAAGVTESYTRHKQLEIAADIKESSFRVHDAHFSDADIANLPTTPYELPDGRMVELGSERLKVPELLFTPSLLSSMPSPMGDYGAGSALADLAGSAASLKGIPAAVADVVNRCDVDIRRELYGGIVLTGGGSLFLNLKERLERDITATAPAAVKVKLLASSSTQERRFGTWLGGSILSSLGTFQQLWMSKREYEEHGASLIHKKCP
jgi:actin-like protein 6A